MLLLVTAAFGLIGQMRPSSSAREPGYSRERQIASGLDICVWSETCSKHAGLVSRVE